jgi:hypothetical protein
MNGVKVYRKAIVPQAVKKEAIRILYSPMTMKFPTGPISFIGYFVSFKFSFAMKISIFKVSNIDRKVIVNSFSRSCQLCIAYKASNVNTTITDIDAISARTNKDLRVISID